MSGLDVFFLRRLPTVLAVSVAVSFGGCERSSSPAATTTAPPRSASLCSFDAPTCLRLRREITQVIARFHVPGISVAIASRGVLRWSDAFGYADLEARTPASVDTLFRTASMGKPLTATAVLRLAERGIVDLDAPVQRYCPAFPVRTGIVTLHQLLSHTAGIRDKTAPEEHSSLHFESSTKAIDVFRDSPLLFAPGTAFKYSSYGYTLVGCAVEGATGLGFMAVMQREVFDPAGMTHTREDVASAVIGGRVKGYEAVPGDAAEAGDVRPAFRDDMSNRLPAGGYLSTAEDLVRFGLALTSGRLLSQGSLRDMTRPRSGEGKVPPPGAAPLEDGYALGWLVGSTDDGVELQHGGSTPGASGLLYLLPAQGFVLAFMTNLESMPGRSDLATALWNVVKDANR